MFYFYHVSVKNIGTSKNMLFKVFSHSVNGWSESEPLEYNLPENVKTRAVTAGLIGGILFFIVAIILSVCTVKICNKARRRKQERGNFKIYSQDYFNKNIMCWVLLSLCWCDYIFIIWLGSSAQTRTWFSSCMNVILQK